MTPSWTIAPARNGRPALRRPDGTWYESRFRPDVDASRRVAEAGVEDGETVLLLGAGAGEMPAAILDIVGAQGRLVVAEPEAGVIEALRAAGFAHPWNDARLTLHAIGTPAADDPPTIRAHPETASLLKTLAALEAFDRFVVHPGLHLSDSLAGLATILDDLEIRRRSWRRFEDVIQENLVRNRDRFLAAPGVNELRGLLQGTTIVVAGGGPSLDRLAPRIGGDANWVAVGRALRTLACFGIDPLLAVITDPQDAAARQIEGLAAPPLVAFPTTAWRAVAHAERLFAAFPDGEGSRRLAPLREEIGELPAGGTVVTTAIGLGILLGARRILLAGVDLTEPDGRSHARGGAAEAAEIASLSRFRSSEEMRRRRETDLMKRGERTEVRSIRGEVVPSRRNLQIYARAIEELVRRNPEVEFIQLAANASPLAGVRFAEEIPPAPPRASFSIPTGTRMRKNRDLL